MNYNYLMYTTTLPCSIRLDRQCVFERLIRKGQQGEPLSNEERADWVVLAEVTCITLHYTTLII